MPLDPKIMHQSTVARRIALVTTPLISVVIPAYNAAATIAETLRSVQTQTHSALEIIVVDDGSTDSTGAIVREFAAADPRIRLLSQDNRGVCAARNHGWRNARSDLIAFVDADDLWSPLKLERQLLKLQASGDRLGLVYSWYARIDGNGGVIDRGPAARIEGKVLDQLFEHNFIGNGSSALVRRAALIAVGGFDEALYQGCEDFMFYCRVAESHELSVVPYYDIGYRFSRESLSSNAYRMLCNWLLVMAELGSRHPGKQPHLMVGLRRCSRSLIRQALFARRPGQLARMLLLLLRRHPRIGVDMLFRVLPQTIIEVAARKLRQRFLTKGPSSTWPARFPAVPHRSNHEP